jgi:hypothetical protein
MATHGVNIVAGLVSLRLSECEHFQHFLLAQMWKPCRVAASRALTVPFLPAILSPALRCRVLGMRFWIVSRDGLLLDARKRSVCCAVGVKISCVH